MFCDLNVPYTSAGSAGQASADAEQTTKKTFDALQSFGYQVVAMNYTIEGKIPPNLTNPIKRIGAEGSSKPFIDVPGTSLGSQKKGSEMYQLSRLTIVCDDINQTFGFNNNSSLLQFDILAIQPQNDKVFQQACTTFDVDIITLDMTGRLPFNLKHTTVGLAVTRGIHFEITYSASLRDANARRYLLSNAANLVRVTRGKNVIVSSQAQRALEVRGPYDVANLCTLFGMNQALGMDAVSANPRKVVVHAHTRKTHKGAVLIEE